MKRVISACILQDIFFDNEDEFKDYLFKLENGKQDYIIENKTINPSGTVLVRIRKQYNNNKLQKEGGKR